MPNPTLAPVGDRRLDERSGTEPRLEPRPHFESAVGDPDGMQPAHGTAAAQLQHADMAQRPQLGQFVGEMQHPVDHGVLGEEPALPLGVGQQNDDASREIREHLQFVEKLLEIPVRRRRLLRGHETVDDGQSCRLLCHDATDQRDQAAQSLGFERAEATDVIHGFGNLRFVEEGHPAQMAKHPRMRLGEQRDVDRPAALGRVVEARLVGQDRLARAGRPLDDVDPGLEQAAIEDADRDRECRSDVALAARFDRSLALLTPLVPVRTSRERDGKCRTPADGAVDTDRASHRGADVAHHPEADAEPATPAGFRATFEALEDDVLLVWRDADAVSPARSASRRARRPPRSRESDGRRRTGWRSTPGFGRSGPDAGDPTSRSRSPASSP